MIRCVKRGMSNKDGLGEDGLGEDGCVGIFRCLGNIPRASPRPIAPLK